MRANCLRGAGLQFNLVVICIFSRLPTSESGQTEKNSVRANVFRSPPESGHPGRDERGWSSFQIQHYANLRTALSDVIPPRNGLKRPYPSPAAQIRLIS